MVKKFADFELDGSRRELRLRGREVVLQPRVLDLLLFLVDHRDRVVTKEELLEALWPDVVVADGAVHRAVSLARSALQQGGMEQAIRTQARVGYRFRADVAEVDADSSKVTVALATARRAFDGSEWNGARAAFSEADVEKALEAADLERWATACQFSGRMQEAIAPLERAVAAHASAGDRRGAARAAISLANIELEACKDAVARGWRNRAATYLANELECREHGFLAWITGRLAIFAGAMESALEQGTLALEIGRRLDDPDLEALGLNYQALVHLALGDTRRGVPLQDEAAAAVLSGQVGPWAGGIVFCGLIWGCVNRADWRRANQWTDNFDRWMDRHGGVEPFPGLCRLHRAEILTMRGELAKAERELMALHEVLAATAPYAEGDFFRVLGDVRMARGDLDGADEAFRRAYELGWDPQPGRAMLQVQQGKAEQAMRALELSLETQSWVSMQRRTVLLAHLVVVAVAAGQAERARSALAELDADRGLRDSPALDALVTRARAELALSEGRRTEAITALRRAAALWHDVGSPFAEGRLRIRLAELLRADGDLETADLELAAAKRTFREVGLAGRDIESG